LRAPHGLAAPNQQSAQAQEREHRTNHDDKPDDIDNSVHSSAPSALSVLPQLQTPGVLKRFAGAPAVFLQNRGTKTNDAASAFEALTPIEIIFAFTRKGG
jgi:hypothetical protein